MNRITEFELAGKKYPLNFSVKAARMVDEKYGGIEKLANAFDGSSGIGKMMTTLTDIMHVLMEQGAAYQKITDGKETDIPSLDEFEVLIGMGDITMLQQSLFEAIGIGSTATVETEPDTKNEKTTQND